MRRPQDIAQAAAWFQLSPKAASDFLGAVFYLGAVHAASGGDVNAVGAWQMSLIGDGGDRASHSSSMPCCARAMHKARSISSPKRQDAWPSDDARHRRVAIAQAMLGQYGVALEGVNALLAKAPDDLDVSLLPCRCSTGATPSRRWPHRTTIALRSTRRAINAAAVRRRPWWARGCAKLPSNSRISNDLRSMTEVLQSVGGVPATFGRQTNDTCYRALRAQGLRRHP
jgi:hypothetical protein